VPVNAAMPRQLIGVDVGGEVASLRREVLSEPVVVRTARAHTERLIEQLVDTARGNSRLRSPRWA